MRGTQADRTKKPSDLPGTYTLGGRNWKRESELTDREQRRNLRDVRCLRHIVGFARESA
jgi:hypothetical protein